ncbi:rab-like protein 3 [Oppia nitens]|uniref:rab-like protein 3 n=1 Tax=Oppia nitens TaxID=1686743 RepID=UPI0023DAB8C8|nr:rab-like protein 3 [Oppia nitens]
MSSTDKTKVLVLGDSGVGKSSLVHLICQGQVIHNPQWTIGVTIDIKLHEYKEGTPEQRTTFIELWDIGGSRSHATARNVFYNGFHGIILVHDLTNRKSEQNLSKWLGHVFYSKDQTIKDNNTSINTSSISAALFPVNVNDEFDFDREAFFERNIPVLVVATKLDSVATSHISCRQPSPLIEECGAQEIQVDCHQSRSIAPGTGNAVKLSRFLDKVCERRLLINNSFNYIDRNKRHSQIYSNKYSHID